MVAGPTGTNAAPAAAVVAEGVDDAVDMPPEHYVCVNDALRERVPDGLLAEHEADLLKALSKVCGSAQASPAPSQPSSAANPDISALLEGSDEFLLAPGEELGHPLEPPGTVAPLITTFLTLTRNPSPAQHRRGRRAQTRSTRTTLLPWSWRPMRSRVIRSPRQVRRPAGLGFTTPGAQTVTRTAPPRPPGPDGEHAHEVVAMDVDSAPAGVRGPGLSTALRRLTCRCTARLSPPRPAAQRPRYVPVEREDGRHAQADIDRADEPPPRGKGRAVEPPGAAGPLLIISRPGSQPLCSTAASAAAPTQPRRTGVCTHGS
jgi:hypothetical protein